MSEKRTAEEILQNLENVAQNLYQAACANEQSNLVGSMLTSITLETADAKQLAIDIADVIVTFRAVSRKYNLRMN